MDQNERFSGFDYNEIVEALDNQEEVNEALEINKHVVDKTYWESLRKSCVTKGKMEYLQSNIDFSITTMYNKVQTTSYLDQQHTQFDKKTESLKEELETQHLNYRDVVDDFITSKNGMCEKLQNLSINFQSENVVRETENLKLSINYKKQQIKEAQAKLLLLQSQEDDCLDQEGIDNMKAMAKQCSQESAKYGDSNKVAARVAEVNKNSEYLRKKIAAKSYKLQ